MAFTPEHLAQECVDQGLFFGVNPHYLVAVAHLKSGFKDDASGNLIGPFRLTQALWDANCGDAEFAMDFTSEQITSWRRQCDVFALMTCRTQRSLIEKNAAFPSAVDLYKAQWPDDDKTVLPKAMQDALDATAALIGPAADAVLDEPLQQSLVINDAGETPPVATIEPKPALPTSADALFRMKAPSIMVKLMNDFGFTEIQTAGILGNLGHECDGFDTSRNRIRSGAGAAASAGRNGPAIVA